jgi:outer membrane protein assembly factor BamB
VEVAYSTPCVYRGADGKSALIFNSEAHGITALEPATGAVLWELGGLFDKRVVSSPILASGLIIGACGSGGGGNYVVAVEPGVPAENKPPKQVYAIRRSAPYVPTSISVGDHLFLWSDGGIVSCVKAASGEIKWQERVGGNYFGSPVFADNKLFCVSTRGEVVAIAASDKFEVLGRTPLEETCHSTPAVAGGRLYVRTVKHLFSLGGRTEAAAP